ncbi:hypothetical protein [Pectobacterium brasiliense]|uniref:hypothetical protein n=1 Tax=Pectobacterium brasiliense TaxID=180957 RepID=UPI0009078953
MALEKQLQIHATCYMLHATCYMLHATCYMLHAKNLPRRSDIVFKSRKSVIFIHGCFWHGHDCKYATIPVSRQGFWIQEFQKNVERDRKKYATLDEMG